MEVLGSRAAYLADQRWLYNHDQASVFAMSGAKSDLHYYTGVEQPMTEQELRADVNRFCAELAEKTGEEINADEVWEELQKRRVK